MTQHFSVTRITGFPLCRTAVVLAALALTALGVVDPTLIGGVPDSVTAAAEVAEIATGSLPSDWPW